MNVNDSNTDEFMQYTKLFVKAPSVVECLLKIFYHSNSITAMKWEKDLYKLLHKVDFLKVPNRFPSKELMIDALWYSTVDLFDSRDHQDYVDNINDECMPEEGYIDKLIPEAKYFCRDYINDISDVLSQKGYIDRLEADKKVRELLSKYRR